MAPTWEDLEREAAQHGLMLGRSAPDVAVCGNCGASYPSFLVDPDGWDVEGDMTFRQCDRCQAMMSGQLMAIPCDR